MLHLAAVRQEGECPEALVHLALLERQVGPWWAVSARRQGQEMVEAAPWEVSVNAPVAVEAEGVRQAGNCYPDCLRQANCYPDCLRQGQNHATCLLRYNLHARQNSNFPILPLLLLRQALVQTTWQRWVPKEYSGEEREFDVCFPKSRDHPRCSFHVTGPWQRQ